MKPDCRAILAIALIWGTTPAVSSAQKDDDQPIDDWELIVAVESRLLRSENVASYDVDVQAQEGVVTLSGEVGSLLAKDRAAEIAREVQGVRAVIDEITVNPSPRPDSEIWSDVVAAFAANPATDSYELTAEVADGEVTLTGTVQSWAEWNLSGDVVRGVRGVRAVENQIQIQYTADRSDQEIAADIRERLANSVRVDDASLKVSVNDGAVTLSGAVGSAAERQRAEFLAWVAGVRKVDTSQVNVDRWWARNNELRQRQIYEERTDPQTEAAIRSAFILEPLLVGEEITVNVRDSVAYLRGQVESLAARIAAEEAAEQVVGVRRVQNYLKVRPSERPTDAELTKSVQAALARNADTDSYQITVGVQNGMVTLSGVVDTIHEGHRAEKVVSNVNGVRDVRNYLIYDYYTAQEVIEDQEIKEDIEDEMYWSPFIDSDNVFVSVEEGKATLTGTVPGYSEKRAATENAFEGGASAVFNKLTVDPSIEE